MSWAVGRGINVYYARKDRAQAASSGPGVNGRMEEDDYIDATHSSANIMTPTSGQSESGDGTGADGAGGFGLNDDASAASPTGKGGASVNGERIRVAIERFGFVEGVKAGMTGTAFLMAVVGIWGDGVGVRQ